MSATKLYSVWRLLFRSLLPSGISAAGCLVGGIAIVVVHILSLSLQYGTLLPTILDGQWAADYTNHVVQPIASVLHAPIAGYIVLAVGWGLAGLVLFEIVEYISRAVREFRATEHKVRIINDRAVIHHPLRETFLKRALWRVCVGMGAVSITFFMLPLFRWLVGLNYRLFVEPPTTATALAIVGGIVVWALLLHIYVILLRLYCLRTRLGNDLLY